MRHPCAIFDLDGTLVDSAPDLTRAMNYALAQEGRPDVPLSEVRDMVGHGALATIRKGLEATGGAVSDARLAVLHAEFLAYYSDHVAVETTLYKGVLETLEGLRASGVRMGICTNKPEGLSQKLLNELDLARFFDAIVGGDTLDVRKPDPQHIGATIDRVNGDPARAIMIGDSSSDVLAAKALGVPVILVSYGYADGAPEDLGADHTVDTFAEVNRYIRTYLTL